MIGENLSRVPAKKTYKEMNAQNIHQILFKNLYFRLKVSY